MDTFIFCLSSSEPQAATIVRKLKSAGFNDHHISALFPDPTGTAEFAQKHHTKPDSTPIPNRFAGLLEGLSSLVIPGLGPFIASGPITAALGGPAMGGRSAGGLTSALITMGIPEQDAWRLEGKVKDGDILISALAADQDQSKAAEEVFRHGGATDITISFQADPHPAQLHPGAFEQFRTASHHHDPMD